jgi:hypothetical protein
MASAKVCGPGPSLTPRDHEEIGQLETRLGELA